MRHLLLAAAGLLLAPVAFAEPAEAGEYCREYTRNIRVGNRIEQGYGKACMRPDGDWEVVSSSDGIDPYVILPDDLRGRVVHYNTYYEAPRRQVVVVPAYRYVYHGPRHYAPTYKWRDNDWRHDRRDWGRDDDRHRGRGRGHDRH